MKWINFLHIYQPPAQPREVVEKIADESYFLILDLFAKYPSLHLTMNISGSLLELLDRYDEQEIIAGFKKYVGEGRLELVGSAMYHPILPLIPESEVRRQIELNNKTLQKYFGPLTLRGFYLPEMAYSPEVGKIIKDSGFEWIILDDFAHFVQEENAFPSFEKLYKIKESGLGVVFRNREVSSTFPPEYIGTHLKNLPAILITAHDGEMYGHRHDNDRGFFETVLSHEEIETQTISHYQTELAKNNAAISTISPRAGSWETTEAEKVSGVAFALWDDPKNEIHQRLWKFANRAIELVEGSKNKSSENPEKHYEIARTLLDKGLASCAWWWASNRNLGAFSPPAWNPTEVERGARHLLDAVRSLTSLPAKEHARVEEQFAELTELVWKQHWQLYTKDNG